MEIEDFNTAQKCYKRIAELKENSLEIKRCLALAHKKKTSPIISVGYHNENNKAILNKELAIETMERQLTIVEAEIYQENETILNL